ncbi:hypothetical protein [Paenibacillus polymyxa]|uniref:Uncharacterized protein n=1 Tax=Paenibacillus polymyxa (strain SC2) TaxID=886882 RepID=E3EK25_PAEPS|nr:hypothetical protein [Paenibacillus polymyxa]ADO59734.1 hypothetical protein PPSC2_26500 [Paenibacillus polymyxa SC2]WPQ60029.1 hypothetical protein SKN87_27690 [Paenibacillus polymyxa]
MNRDILNDFIVQSNLKKQNVCSALKDVIVIDPEGEYNMLKKAEGECDIIITPYGNSGGDFI